MASLETLFSAVSPQSTLGGEASGPDALADLALACRGMKYEAWQGLLWRFLRDDKARAYLDQRLARIALQARSQCVRDRALLLARLVTAEEHHRLEVLESSGAEHILLRASRRDWREKLRPEFLRLRARLDLWCRAGSSLIRQRLRES